MRTCKFSDTSLLKKSTFTLIELLVVVAIIAILAAMLLPVLGRAKYSVKEVVCLNNMKQQSLAIFHYADDYDEYYLSTARPGQPHTEPHDGIQYDNGPWGRRTENIAKLLEYMSFTNGHQYTPAAAEASSCPFIFDKYMQHTTNTKTVTIDGVSTVVKRFPCGNDWGRTGYMYYYTWMRAKWGIVVTPMKKLGDAAVYGNWSLGDGASSRESKLMMSDMQGDWRNQGLYWLSNHPPKGGQLVTDVEPDKNFDGFFWKSHTQGGHLMAGEYSANFLMDDGSAVTERNLGIGKVAVGVHILTIPLHYFE